MDDLTFGLVEKPVYVRRDARGVFEELLNTGRWESLIAGRMSAGAVLGHHYHAHTIVAFFLLEGRSRIVTIDVGTKARREVEIHAGQGFVFRPSEARAIVHQEDVRFLLLKSHRFDPAAPDLIAYPVA
jgi:mannose-6-phosphate isomerase-like protein (cupin superfamily)